MRVDASFGVRVGVSGEQIRRSLRRSRSKCTKNNAKEFAYELFPPTSTRQNLLTSKTRRIPISITLVHLLSASIYPKLPQSYVCQSFQTLTPYKLDKISVGVLGGVLGGISVGMVVGVIHERRVGLRFGLHVGVWQRFV